MGSIRQANVLRLEPTMSQSGIHQPSMAPPGGMLPDSQASYDIWPQVSQTGGQQCPNPYAGMQARPQPSFTSPDRPSQSPMRFRSAFAKQQVARSQSPLGRLSQRSFSRPNNTVNFSPSQEGTPPQHMCLSQQPSLAFHPAPSVGAGAGYAQPMQQPLPLSQLDPLLQASQHQRHLHVQEFTTHQGSQNERPASATHQVVTPVDSLFAAQTGTQSASATASKLLDQIGQVSSLQRQMTQLTAEVKETMKACEGIAGIAHDVKALTTSFQDIKEQLQLIRTECTEEASKGYQLGSKLQDTCKQLVAELQKLSSNATAASLLGLQQQNQPISQRQNIQLDQDVQCLSQCEGAEFRAGESEPAPKPAKRQGIKSRLTEYRRSRAKAAAPVDQPTSTVLKHLDSSATNQGIYQPCGEQHQAAAQLTRGLRGIGTCCQSKEGDCIVEKYVQEPTDSVSRKRKDMSHASSSLVPSLKLCLQPLKESSMPPNTCSATAGHSVPLELSASSTANAHAEGNAGKEAILPAKRRSGQQHCMGLDVFTKLFAQTDSVSCQQASILPVIQEDVIAKEVTERLMMQRMRCMQA